MTITTNDTPIVSLKKYDCIFPKRKHAVAAIKTETHEENRKHQKQSLKPRRSKIVTHTSSASMLTKHKWLKMLPTINHANTNTILNTPKEPSIKSF